MNLCLLEVKHIYDEENEVVGIFATDSDVEVAKNLYLKNKEDLGLKKNEFTFRVSHYVLGDIQY